MNSDVRWQQRFDNFPILMGLKEWGELQIKG